jgi:hypothetical protein
VPSTGECVRRPTDPCPALPASLAADAVLRVHAAHGGLRVFSPDELAPNRLANLAWQALVVEMLSEGCCWAATGVLPRKPESAHGLSAPGSP